MPGEERDDDVTLELLWGDRTRPRRGPRPGLSVERIVGTGIEVADTDGLSAVSMSRVAKSLGSPLMSLYRYVHSKDQLVQLMLDAAIGPPPDLAAVPGGWRPKLERWARENERVFRAHPWTLTVVTVRRVVGPNEMAWLESALEVVADIGLSDGEMLNAVLLVNAYARGNAQNSVHTADAALQTGRGWPPVYSTIFANEATRQRFPRVAGLSEAGVMGKSSDDFGLARILDGIQGYVDGRET